MGLIGNLIKKATTITPMRPFPFTVDGANLRYAYDLDIYPTSPGSVASVLGREEKVVDVGMDGDSVTLSYNGKIFATIQDQMKCQMVKDYFRRGDPVNAILRENKTINLRFYRDMRKIAKESEVVTLTAYKSKACQDTLVYLNAGDELGCYEAGGKIAVCDYLKQYGNIGNMPSQIVKRAEHDTIRAVYLEELQEGVGKNCETMYIPVVRVYW